MIRFSLGDAILLGALSAPAPAADAVTVEVRAGTSRRHDVPVSLTLPKSLAAAKGLSLTRLDTKQPTPVQRVAGPAPSIVWMLAEPLKAGQVRRYRLAAAEAPKRTTPPAVTVTDDGKGLEVKLGRRAVLTYRHAVVPSPDPKTPYYRRSGYIHPLRNPAGKVLTDDFAPDHPHQHGVMFPWTKTTFEGKPTEFWNQKLLLGTVEHAALQAVGGGNVFAHFTATLRHVALKAAGGAKTALTETWSVRVYRTAGGFLFDLDSTQRCATDSPLNIAKYHYGGLAVRCRREWIGTGGFLTSERKTRANGNHSRPRWCDVYGTIDGQPTGITVFCHPGNFRFPQPVRLHPSKPYFCFSPMVLGAFRIEPSRPYVSRYRFYVHDGKVDAARANALWNDYAHPAKVRIVE